MFLKEIGQGLMFGGGASGLARMGWGGKPQQPSVYYLKKENPQNVQHCSASIKMAQDASLTTFLCP